MAMRIDPDECTVCGACEFECPNSAIRMKGDTYIINPDKCTECEGVHDSPKCVSECPSDCIYPAAA